MHGRGVFYVVVGVCAGCKVSQRSRRGRRVCNWVDGIVAYAVAVNIYVEFMLFPITA